MLLVVFGIVEAIVARYERARDSDNVWEEPGKSNRVTVPCYVEHAGIS
jgi:hypothetical protein